MSIFNLFLIYGLFLSINSLTDITLDSINKPKYNFIKVSIMVLINISGDIMATLLFKSLIAVALIAILSLFNHRYLVFKERVVDQSPKDILLWMDEL
jgi:O-antigen/teichoic acid export membrane protein